MKSLSESLEERIKIKLEGLRNCKNIEQVLRKTAQEIVFRKYDAAFYDYTYKILYKNIDLARKKPFINIGPGSFRHPYWTNVDRRYLGKGWTQVRRSSNDNKPDIEWNFFSKDKMPVKDSSFYLAYCSHVIEHGYDEDIHFLLSEIYRVLTNDAILRIVCPDAEIFRYIYIYENYFSICNYLSTKTHRIHYKKLINDTNNIKISASYFLLDMFSLLRVKDNPVYLEGEHAVSFFEGKNFYSSLDEASNLSSREIQKLVAGHVNWFNFEKLSYFLEKAGFQDIRKVGYLQSSSPLLQDALLFDKTDKEFSLYVEARK